MEESRVDETRNAENNEEYREEQEYTFIDTQMFLCTEAFPSVIGLCVFCFCFLNVLAF